MLSRIKSILKRNGYRLYTRPFELNIVGLRSKSIRANQFDDELHVFYMVDDKKWAYHYFKITTDPGTYWLSNPAMEHGTAILSQGQYVDAYAIGKHQGKYEALVQVKPVTVIRDYDRNAILDFRNGRKETGLFGINIHRANSAGSTVEIDKYSAGCQVFQNAKDFDVFMELCRKHAGIYCNKFTYSLVDFRALRRETLKRVAMATTFAASFTFGWLFMDEEDEV